MKKKNTEKVQNYKGGEIRRAVDDFIAISSKATRMAVHTWSIFRQPRRPITAAEAETPAMGVCRRGVEPEVNINDNASLRRPILPGWGWKRWWEITMPVFLIVTMVVHWWRYSALGSAFVELRGLAGAFRVLPAWMCWSAVKWYTWWFISTWCYAGNVSWGNLSTRPVQAVPRERRPIRGWRGGDLHRLGVAASEASACETAQAIVDARHASS